jgi:ribonucleoside-diphosphate reductase alpha chain
MAAIDNIKEFEDVVRIASKFLVCGTIRGDLPYDRVYEVRQKNRRLGLGLMGMHEWLLQRNYPYEVVQELHEWLSVYQYGSEKAANEHCDRLFLSRPVAYRAIAPTGSIALLAGTTSGIEPLFAVAYKRRYLKNGDKWHYTYVIDHMAQEMIDKYGLNPDEIDTAADLAKDVERRIKFQADVQDYVDMGISSTINLPAWGSEHNNEDHVMPFAETLASYAHRLRGFTAYPDGARGGQPITAVPYGEAAANANVEFEENSDAGCQSGVCGI